MVVNARRVAAGFVGADWTWREIVPFVVPETVCMQAILYSYKAG